jgi:creatinine amidohydrolase/Fe(II)-dependent formamide hydrolase-like protein
MMQLNAHPIPGMSLTGEPGNTPWEQPPMFVELDDVINYYVEKMTEPEAVDNLLKAMETNAPLVSMANVAIKAGMMKGIHSIDVGVIAVPILVELMKTIGDMNDVGYVVEDGDMNNAIDITEEEARSVLADAVKKVEEVVDDAAPRKGLMGKGVKE